MKFSCSDMAWALSFGAACGFALGLALGNITSQKNSKPVPSSLEPRPELPEDTLLGE